METATLCSNCGGFFIAPDKPDDERSTLICERDEVLTSSAQGCRMCLLLKCYWRYNASSMKLTWHNASFGSWLDVSFCEVGWSMGPVFALEPLTTVIDKPMMRIKSTNDTITTVPTNFDSRPTSTGDDASFSTIRAWIENCTKNHTKCGAPIDTFKASKLPTRLVDVSREDQLHLVETTSQTFTHLKAKYATLSHRWDSRNEARLLRSNFESWTSRIDLSELPLVFRDAIDATRRLSLQYIWIDALCIIQDEPEDWKKESAMMGQIYRNAFINFGATAAATEEAEYSTFRLDVDNSMGRSPVGLYMSRNPWKFAAIPLRYQRKGVERYVVVYNQDTVATINNEELMARSWVMQERLLSPRSVFFGEQLKWECAEVLAGEVFPTGNPPYYGIPAPWWGNHTPNRMVTLLNSLYSNVGPQRDLAGFGDKYRVWLSFVEAYTATKLTYGNDIFPAISGLAECFQSVLDDEYVAGIWRKDVLRGLLWEVDYSQRDPDELYEGYYRAPSWSWASALRRVHFPLYTYVEVNMEKEIFIADLQEVVVDLTDQDPMGQVSGGFLRIAGPLFRIRNGKTLSRSIRRFEMGIMYDIEKKDTEASIDAPNTFYFVISYRASAKKGRVDNIHGLILELADRGLNTFRRIGLLKIPNALRRHEHGGFEDADCPPELANFDPEHAEKTTITII